MRFIYEFFRTLCVNRLLTKIFVLFLEPSVDGTEQFHIDRTKACRLSCQCCLDLHNNLNHFPTPVAGKFFTLHIGVGYGKVTILQVRQPLPLKKKISWVYVLLSLSY